jgi:hypothetical protein
MVDVCADEFCFLLLSLSLYLSNQCLRRCTEPSRTCKMPKAPFSHPSFLISHSYPVSYLIPLRSGVFKNQIDWIPLNSGSVRPTQGRTCCVSQVNGGSQSFNAVNALRLLARWMRMPCCTNQSSVAKAWKEFDDDGRMKPSSFRDRVVDVAEEFAKFTAVMVPVSDDLTNRYSERKEKLAEGKLLTQAEKEARTDNTTTVAESRKG